MKGSNRAYLFRIKNVTIQGSKLFWGSNRTHSEIKQNIEGSKEHALVWKKKMLGHHKNICGPRRKIQGSNRENIWMDENDNMAAGLYSCVLSWRVLSKNLKHLLLILPASHIASRTVPKPPFELCLKHILSNSKCFESQSRSLNSNTLDPKLPPNQSSKTML